MSQLVLFNPPVAGLFEALGLNLSGPELYPGWGDFPGAREAFYAFLREHALIDNVVLSGDSHGWFAYDLVEDHALPAYEPLTGGGLQPPVGVEIVPSAMGRANGVEVIANIAYEAANGGPPLADSENFRRFWVPPALPLTIAVETAAQLVNLNLRFFNWRSFGYGIAQLADDAATLELWEVPHPERSDSQRLLRQFRSRVGRPHLAPVLAAQASHGSRQDPPPPEAFPATPAPF